MRADSKPATIRLRNMDNMAAGARWGFEVGSGVGVWW